jgi:N utilization substance protein B
VTAHDDEDADTAAAAARRGDLRHQGREAALQMLYQREIGRLSFHEVVRTFWTIDQYAGEPDDRVRSFARSLAEGTIESLDKIDALIAERTENWRPERMAVLDRLILRLGAYELLQGETPPNVVINEALELARTFSGEDSVRFINGVLDGVRKGLQGA